MPRILQLSPRLPYPLDDGGRIATWNLSRCLHHNGYELDLIGFARDEAAIAAASEPLSQVFKSVSPVLKNVERQYPATLLRALLTGSSYFTRKYYSSRVAELIRQHVARGRYDATLIDSAYMGVYLPVLRRCGAAVGKIVLREHNVEYELLERLAVGDSNPFYRAVLRREAKLFRRYELELVRQVNDVRMISPRDAEVLAAAGVQPAPAVLAPFVDMDRYHCGRAEQVEPESLVCVGNMAWPPNTNGVQWFCEHVWPAVARANPRAKFYIVGKNPPPAIQRLAGENVIVTGYVDDERPYIHRAHLFVVPLLEGSGIRIKILTAMAMGRPVLSTSVGAEGISFSGLTLADSAEAWARAILEHLKQLPSVSHAAVEHIREHYDWRRTLRL